MSSILEKNIRRLSQRGGSVRTFHEQVLLDLTQRFAGSEEQPTTSETSAGSRLGSAFADLVIRVGPRVAVVEVKIGNPDLPLPSSASSQMRVLGQQAEESFHKDVIPVLVTNYRLTIDDRKEFEQQGIKIVPIASALSGYDAQRFSNEFAEIVGLTSRPAASPDASF